MKIDCLNGPDETGRMVEQFQLAILLLYEIKRIGLQDYLQLQDRSLLWYKGPLINSLCNKLYFVRTMEGQQLKVLGALKTFKS
jgi:hypothetical protein